ncbi:MAG: long-subunit fatty acid transport protein [Myxococcota bacterium]|jgi:long-subunit fatty acid transport protein
MILALAVLCSASAASLDAIEVGGPWGTVLSDEPTALWWNPAGIAVRGGTQIQLEAAPIWGDVGFERSNPNGGVGDLRSGGVLPFGGITSDLTVPGLGVGMGMAVPVARPGNQQEPGSPGSYHLRAGEITQVHGILAAAYAFRDIVAIGATVQLVSSTWVADLDYDALPDLIDEMQALGIDEIDGLEIDYTDEDLESEDYRVTLDFDHLKDTAVTWSVGGRVQPIPPLAFGFTYVAPYRVDNEGDTTMAFGCPSQDDTVGRYGMEAFGLCDANAGGRTLDARGTVGFSMPARMHFGVMATPIEALRLELFGAYITWSRFTDFEISIDDIGELNTFDTKLQKTRTPALTEQKRLWARDNVNTYFFALDAKYTVSPVWLVGARATLDRSAIPDSALSTNNYDASQWILMAHAAASPMPQLRIGLSFSEYLAATREITDSAFSMAIDPAARKSDRYNYPQMNGSYRSNVHRFGLNVTAKL